MATDRFGVGAEFLAQTNRSRILQMGAAGLYEIGPVGRPRRQFVGQLLERPVQIRQELQRRQGDCGGNHVVGGLSHVDVVVGVHRRVFAAPTAEQFVGAVGQYLVGVHVVRRPRPGLEDVDHELVQVPPLLQHFFGGGDDRVRQARFQPPAPAVHQRGGFFDCDCRPHECGVRRQPGNREIRTGPLSLDSPQGLVFDRQFAQRVFFDSHAVSPIQPG